MIDDEDKDEEEKALAIYNEDEEEAQQSSGYNNLPVPAFGLAVCCLWKPGLHNWPLMEINLLFCFSS